MAVFSKESHSGELMVDHRSSPGLSRQKAESMGLDPTTFREGSYTHLRTRGCCHCGGVWVVNPWRVRPRYDCSKCDKDVCEACAAAMREPGYTHRSFQEFADMIRSGKWKLIGGDLRRPVLARSNNNG